MLRLASSSLGTLLVYGGLMFVVGRAPEDDQLLRMLRLKK
jgi:hypothetical protein